MSPPVTALLVLVPAIFVLAAVVRAVTWLEQYFGSAFSWKWKMGTPSFDFGQSWATTTNFTAGLVNFALTTFLAGSKVAFVAVNAGFFLLGGLAPCLYNAVREAKVETPSSGTQVVYRGYVITYFVCCVLALACAFGQLTMFGTIVWTAQQPELGATLRLGLAAVVCIYVGLLWVHAARSMFWTVVAQHPSASDQLQLHPQTGTPMPWPLL